MSRTLPKLACVLIPAIVAASIAVAQGPHKPAPFDDEDADLSGRQAFVENCLICHGEEMSTAQRLTTKQWTAEVDKMVGWGAPVPPDKKAALLAYLTASFSDHAPVAPSDTATATALIAAEIPRDSISRGDPGRGGPLYTQHCATCHGATGQGGDLGPNLVERSILLRETAYHDTVRKGLRRMPGFAPILKADAENDLLAWLRSRRTP